MFVSVDKTLMNRTFMGNLIIFSLLLGMFIPNVAFANSMYTTYQAKIIKPDGIPLEAANVNFRFTILDPVGSCILYTENFNFINMSDSAGLVSFSLGSGIKTYPTSGAVNFSDVFNNQVSSLACDAGAPAYIPQANDLRKIVMQFHDGSGWQTMPAMSINHVPYAMYAKSAASATTAVNSLQLNGKTDADFVQKSSIPTCGVSQTLQFNGASFNCMGIAGVGGGGVLLSVSGTAPIAITGSVSAPMISINVASMSSDGYLTAIDYAEFKTKLSASSTSITSALGYDPVSGSAVAAQIAAANLSGDVSGTTSSNSVITVGGKTAAEISASVDDTLLATASSTANTIVKRNASGNAQFGGISATAASLNYVDIYKPSSSFNIRLQAPTSLSTNYVLNLPTTSGTIGQVLSTDGAGNLSWIDSATGSVTSVSGTAGEITSSGGATPALGLANAGTAGTYYKVITDNKGRVTSGATTLTLSDLPNNLLTTTSNFAGDISGMIANITVNRIQGVSVTVTSLATNDILQYDGAKYVNRNIPTCGGSQYLTFNGTSFSCVADAGASGTITTLSVAGPISSTGGANPTLSIAQANSTTNGYLSSTDWNTFNNKQNATSAAIIATLGYTPANATSFTTLSSNVSSLQSATSTSFTTLTNNINSVSSSVSSLAASTAASLSAITSSQWSNVASGISYMAGHVGIGTINPGQVMEVSKAQDAVTALNVVNSSNSTNASTKISVNSNAVEGAIYTTAENYVGNFSGVSAADSFVVRSAGSVPAANMFVGTGSSSPLHFITDNSIRFSVATNGNVGVGTITPAAKFHVNANSGSNTIALFANNDFVLNSTGSGLLLTTSATTGNTSVKLQAFGAGNTNVQNLVLNAAGGNVGIGTTTPATKLSVSGGVQISMESATCTISYAGTLRYSAGNVEYCNGSTWSAFGVATAGVNSLNGSTSQTQTFAAGTTGNLPAFVTANGVHTLNIPLASATGSVTAGLISNSDYVSFSNKITSSAASIAQVLGYVPASATVLGNYLVKTNNLSDLSSSATARTNLGLGGFATISSLNLGSASATGTLAAARLPAMAGDVSSSAGSNSLTVVGLQGRSVVATAPASGQVLAYNGAAWAPYTVATSQWNTSGTTINYTAGNVGVGTTSPGAKLEVTAGANSNGALRVYASGTTSGSFAAQTYMTGTATWSVGSEAGNGRFFIYNNAALSDQLHFTGGINSSVYMNALGTGDVSLQSGGLVRLTVKPSGNVGIGTSNPTTTLHVSGTLLVTDRIKIQGTTGLPAPQMP